MTTCSERDRRSFLRRAIGAVLGVLRRAGRPPLDTSIDVPGDQPAGSKP